METILLCVFQNQLVLNVQPDNVMQITDDNDFKSWKTICGRLYQELKWLYFSYFYLHLWIEFVTTIYKGCYFRDFVHSFIYTENKSINKNMLLTSFCDYNMCQKIKSIIVARVKNKRWQMFSIIFPRFYRLVRSNNNTH